MIIILNESLFIRQISICVWIKCHLAIVEINLEMWERFVRERGAAYLWLENGGEKKVVFKVRDRRSWMTTLISISSKHSLVLWGHLVWLLCCKGASCIIRRLLPCSKKTQALQTHKACVTPATLVLSGWSAPITPKWHSWASWGGGAQIKPETACCLTMKWFAWGLGEGRIEQYGL